MTNRVKTIANVKTEDGILILRMLNLIDELNIESIHVSMSIEHSGCANDALCIVRYLYSEQVYHVHMDFMEEDDE